MAISLKAAVKNNLQATQYFFVREEISENGNQVLALTKRISGHPVTIHLEFDKGKIWIKPPNYTFSSTVSHFDYIAQETRWTRRKDTIKNVIQALMRAEVWPFIENKKFFSVNEKCVSFGKKKGLKNRVQEEFQACFDPNARKKPEPQKRKELDKKATELLKAGVK